MTERKRKSAERQELTVLAVQSITKVDMSSLEIAELTKKLHRQVTRDIRELDESLQGMSYKGQAHKIVQSSYVNQQGKKQPLFHLDADTTLTLLTGYYPQARFVLIKRWRELEDMVVKGKIVEDGKVGYKKLMELILRDIPKEEREFNAIKAATTVDKAVSNFFGLSKMVKLKDMTTEMKAVRIKAMEDYEAAFELYHGTGLSVKEFLYQKYAPPMIE